MIRESIAGKRVFVEGEDFSVRNGGDRKAADSKQVSGLLSEVFSN